MHTAYSVMTLKSASESLREFTGTATTISTDLAGDEVLPQGAKYRLPLPMLWEHDRSSPIGHVVEAVVGASGITVRGKLAQVSEPGLLRDRLDLAWHSIRAGLVNGLSVGFLPLASEPLKSGGRKFTAWQWLELSACTIPCNADCSIATVKAAFAASREARAGCVYLDGRITPRLPARRNGVVYLRGARP